MVLSVQGTGGSPTGPDPENRVVIKTLEDQVGQFLLGCKCLVSWSIVVQEQDPPLGDPRCFFLQNVLKSHQQIWVIFRVDSLALWKIINKEYAVLIPKKISRTELFQRIFVLGIFWGGKKRLAIRHTNRPLFPTTLSISSYDMGK